MSHTFPVSSVERSREGLKRTTVHESMNRVLGFPFEASATNIDDLVDFACPNLFLGAPAAAFKSHYPLVISPDDVWLAIAQGFAIHVNNNVETLRSRFVDQNVTGKTLIRVIRDDFIKGSSDNDWAGCFAEFSSKIRDNIGNTVDTVVSSFSTTGPIERAASEVVLMGAVQGYFEYRVQTRCGIPEVTLLGTVDDWKSIRVRAATLTQFELGWWTQHLLPVLDELVNAASGRPDTHMWQSFFKLKSESGGTAVTGWINVFFPYLKDRETRRPTAANTFMSQSQWHLDWGGADSDDFPSGFALAPFVWEYMGTNIPMKFVAGFAGISQDPTTLAIRPVIGWAVAEAKGR